jgi:sec-independent protein translocase protein TatA
MINLSVLLGVVGPWQLALVIIVAVLMFGGKKIPELMKGVGQGIKEFKNAMKENDDDKKLSGSSDKNNEIK